MTQVNATLDEEAFKVWKWMTKREDPHNKYRKKRSGQQIAELALELTNEEIISKTKRKAINFRVENETHKQLKEKAKKTGVSVSHLIEIALWERGEV